MQNFKSNYQLHQILKTPIILLQFSKTLQNKISKIICLWENWNFNFDFRTHIGADGVLKRQPFVLLFLSCFVLLLLRKWKLKHYFHPVFTLLKFQRLHSNTYWNIHIHIWFFIKIYPLIQLQKINIKKSLSWNCSFLIDYSVIFLALEKQFEHKASWQNIFFFKDVNLIYKERKASGERG